MNISDGDGSGGVLGSIGSATKLNNPFFSKRKSKKDNSYLRKSGGEITEIVSSLEQLSLGGGFHKKLTSMKSNRLNTNILHLLIFLIYHRNLSKIIDIPYLSLVLLIQRRVIGTD